MPNDGKIDPKFNLAGAGTGRPTQLHAAKSLRFDAGDVEDDGDIPLDDDVMAQEIARPKAVKPGRKPLSNRGSDALWLDGGDNSGIADGGTLTIDESAIEEESGGGVSGGVVGGEKKPHSKFDIAEPEERKKRMQDLAESLGEKKTHVVQIIVAVLVLAIILVFIIVKTVSNENAKPDLVVNNNIVLSNDLFEVPLMEYSDTVKPKKYAEVLDGTMVFVLEGKPKAFGKNVKFEVPSKIYNAVHDGDTIKIKYQIVSLKVGEKVQDQAVNIQVKTK